MDRERVPAFCAVVFLLAAACSGGEGKERPASPFRQVNRPIVDIVPAASIGEDGQPVDPALVFAPEAPQITLVAQVGEVTGSPMDITWSHVTDEGEVELFTHTVEVASFDAAYSVGESPGTLTPGTYRVEATLEGESLSTQFEVEAPAETGAAGEGATSGPPSSGDSGTVGPPVDPTAGPSETSLFTSVEWAPVDPNASSIKVFVLAGVPGGGGRVEVKATMGGSTRTVSFPTDEAGLVQEILDFDPCVHPGGSDLPGTKATFDTTLYEGNTVAASNTDFTTLGPDTTKPGITINSEPRAGSRVEPGDEILLDATAQENRNGPSWQTGVQTFQLTATPGGQVGEPQQAPSRRPQSCDRKQWSLATQGTYEVPADAPPIIEICGIAEDFAGNIQTTCNKYYAGETWKGTANITSSAVYPDGSTCRDGWKLEFTFGVSPEGTIEGQGTAELTSGPTCPFPIIVPSFEQLEYQVLGEETAGGFSLRFAQAHFELAPGATNAGFFSMFQFDNTGQSPSGGPPVFVAVSGTSGTGQGMWQFQSGITPQATYSANGTITIECVTCEEAVG